MGADLICAHSMNFKKNIDYLFFSYTKGNFADHSK